MLIEHAEVLRRLWVFMGFYDSFMTLGQPLRHRRAVGGGLSQDSSCYIKSRSEGLHTDGQI